MNRLVITTALFSLLIVGCKKPSEVIVNPPESTTVVNPVADTSMSPGTSDSTTVFAEDEQNFGGLLELTMVKNDAWNLSTRTVTTDSLAYARAYFADRLTATPVAVAGAYRGIRLDSAVIDGVRLQEKTHYFGTQPTGYEYRAVMTTRYQPNALNTWMITSDSLGSFTTMIRSTDELRIIAPRSGTVLPKTKPVDLYWSGLGEMTIVVSVWDSANAVAHPALVLKEEEDTGHQRLGLLILAGIFARFPHARYFVISYVLQNRIEDLPVVRYRSSVLVHTVLVYNTYIELL